EFLPSAARAGRGPGQLLWNFGSRRPAAKPVQLEASPEQQAGPEQPDGEGLRGDLQIPADGLSALALELAFAERVDHVRGDPRQASLEHLPECTTLALAERVAVPVERRGPPVAATVEHAFRPTLGPAGLLEALLAPDHPEAVGDLPLEDADQPGADRRPPGE